jgi:hypothetical protein
MNTQNTDKDAQIQFPFLGKVAAIDESVPVALVLDLQSMAAFSLPAQCISAQEWERLHVGQHLRFVDDGFGEIKELEFVSQGTPNTARDTI